MKKSMFQWSITLIICVLISILLVSCEKEARTPSIVKGRILEYYSSNPVENYELIVYEQRSVLYGIIGLAIDTFWTNDLGCFSYSFYHNKLYTYVLGPGDNYYQFTPFEMQEIDCEKTNNYDIKVKPYRSIGLEFINSTNTYEEFTLIHSGLAIINFQDSII